MLKELRRHIMMQQAGGGGVLPPEYQEVDYLTGSADDCKISLNYIPALSDAYDIEFKVSQSRLRTCYFGCANYMAVFTLLYRGYLYGATIGYSETNYVENNDGNSIYNIYYDGTDFYFNGIKVVSEIIKGPNNPTSNASLFNVPVSGWFHEGSFELHRLSISRAGSELFHMVPCYRKSDHTNGLYDIVNNIFYTNELSGTFYVGPDVNW